MLFVVVLLFFVKSFFQRRGWSLFSQENGWKLISGRIQCYWREYLSLDLDLGAWIPEIDIILSSVSCGNPRWLSNLQSASWILSWVMSGHGFMLLVCHLAAAEQVLLPHLAPHQFLLVAFPVSDLVVLPLWCFSQVSWLICEILMRGKKKGKTWNKPFTWWLPSSLQGEW